MISTLTLDIMRKLLTKEISPFAERGLGPRIKIFEYYGVSSQSFLRGQPRFVCVHFVEWDYEFLLQTYYFWYSIQWVGSPTLFDLIQKTKHTFKISWFHRWFHTITRKRHRASTFFLSFSSSGEMQKKKTREKIPSDKYVLLSPKISRGQFSLAGLFRVSLEGLSERGTARCLNMARCSTFGNSLEPPPRKLLI